MDHVDLITEMEELVRKSPLERIQLAKERRALQLFKWHERHDDDYEPDHVIAERKFKLKFRPNITLLEATSRNDVDEVRKLLLEGMDPNVCNEDGLSALHQCAIDNNERLLVLLVEHGANVNARDTELWTPLHAAACCGHLAIVRHLVLNGAELLAVNSDGNMPYDICDEEATLDFIESEMAKRGITQDDIDEERLVHERNMLSDMEYLFKNGRNFEAKDEKGATPLHIASAKGYYTVVKYLLEIGASVHVRDNDGWQPVHAASCWAQPDSLELLVSYGADINARTPAGETPFDMCEDDSVRAVINTLQMEQRRKLLSFARDSRRMSKRRKPSSKFESPNQATSQECNRLSASRGAIRRHSLRDRAGVTLARLEARREAAILRRFSFEGPENFVLPTSNAELDKLSALMESSAATTSDNNDVTVAATSSSNSRGGEDQSVTSLNDVITTMLPDGGAVGPQQQRPRLSWSHKARRLSTGKSRQNAPKVPSDGQNRENLPPDGTPNCDTSNRLESPKSSTVSSTDESALVGQNSRAMTLIEMKRLRASDRRQLDGGQKTSAPSMTSSQSLNGAAGAGKPTALIGGPFGQSANNSDKATRPRRRRRGKVNFCGLSFC